MSAVKGPTALAVLLAVAAGGFAREASAYCWHHKLGTGRYVPVYLIDNGTGESFRDVAPPHVPYNELKAAVNTALQVWNADSQADKILLPLQEWKKPSPWPDGKGSPDSTAPDAIYIRSTLRRGDCLVGGTLRHACGSAPASLCSGKGRRQVCRQTYVVLKDHDHLEPGLRWSLDPLSPVPKEKDIVTALVHEIGHALGSLHVDDNPDNCTWHRKGTNKLMSVMGGVLGGGDDTSEGRTLGRDDIDGMIDVYGRRKWSLWESRSSDGREWGVKQQLTSLFVPDTRIGSTSTDLGHDLAEFYISFPLNHEPFYMFHTRGGSWSLPIRIEEGRKTYYPTAIAANTEAQASSRHLLAAWLDTPGTTEENRIRVAYSIDGGKRWVPQNIGELNGGGGSAVTTRRSGVSAAYDPASDRFLIAFADNNDFINIAIWDPRDLQRSTKVVYVHNVYPHRTSDAPGIACRRPETAVAYNCMMVFSSGYSYTITQSFKMGQRGRSVETGTAEYATGDLGSVAELPALTVRHQGVQPWARFRRDLTSSTAIWTATSYRHLPDTTSKGWTSPGHLAPRASRYISAPSLGSNGDMFRALYLETVP